MKLGIFIFPSLALLACVAHGQTYTWKNTAGGSWDVASNWDTNPSVPVFGPGVVVDFSTLNITGSTKLLNLGSTGKVVGKIKFGDTAPSHQWEIVAQNGPLTLSTTAGQPEIEVKDWSSVITVNVAGSQGFTKTGSNILRLNNTTNAITGEILVSAGTLQIRDGTTNNPAVFAAASMGSRSLRIAAPGILDLFRVDASGTQNITWSLPAITLENGGVLRFRNNNAATYNHSLAANLAIIGTGGGTIQNNGGTGVQSITLGGALSGTSPLAYAVGAGTTRQLTVSSSANSFSGNWTVTHAGAGSAILRAGAAGALGTGTVTLKANAHLLSGAGGSLDSLGGVTLDGAGAVLDLANQSWQNPAASLTVTNGLVLVGGGQVSVGTLAMGGGEIRITVADEASPAVTTAGNANFGGRNLAVTLGVSPIGKVFELVRYGGTLSNPPAVVLGGNAGRLTAVVDNGSGSNDSIRLSFVGTVADLVWSGAVSNVWDDNTTANFLNGGSPDVFRAFDNVRFDDSSAVNTVSLPVSLNASLVTFDHSTVDYTLDGAGAIAGPAALAKFGSGTLTLNTANNFLGPVGINEGGIVLGHAAALGATVPKTVTVETGAFLDFNGVAPGTARGYLYRIAGDGAGGGALVNNSTTGLNENAGVLDLELLGDASVGGTGRFDIGLTGGPSGGASGGIQGNGHTLTKTGSNTIYLRGPAQQVTFVVAEGVLGVQDDQGVLGGASGNVTVNGGARLEVYQSLSVATPLRLEANASISSTGSGGGNWSGPVTLGGSASVSVPAAPLTISGAIGEAGGSFELRKEGGNLLTLAGANAHSGGTVVLGGQVTAGSDTAFGSGTVTVERDDPAGPALRINLANVTIGNDLLLNSNAGTVGRGVLSTANGNTLSVVTGNITLARAPSDGGTFSAFDGGTLRILGAIWSTNGVNPLARSGTIEIGDGQGDYTVFGHGEGTLRLLSPNALVTTARLVTAINGACTLDLNGNYQTLAGLSRQNNFASTVTNSSLTPVVLTIDAATATTFGGVIEDGAGGVEIIKSGPEPWTLGGANTYTGTTTVYQGTLRIDGDQSSATGAITVNGAQSTLAGSGSVGGEVLVANGATLAPGGQGSGLLTAAQPVTLQSGATFRATLDSRARSLSGLVRESNIVIGDGVVLEVEDVAASPAAIPVGTVLVLIDYSRNSPAVTLQGMFAGLPEGTPLVIGANGFTISYADPDRVTLTATGVEDPYLRWCTDPAFGLVSGVNDGFTQDADGDGFANGLEWILGGNPSLYAAAPLVAATRLPGGGLRLTFTREPDSLVSADLRVEFDADLAAPWNSAAIGAASSGPDANGVTVDINTTTNPHQVTVTIPATNQQAGRLFARLATELR